MKFKESTDKRTASRWRIGFDEFFLGTMAIVMLIAVVTLAYIVFAGGG